MAELSTSFNLIFNNDVVKENTLENPISEFRVEAGKINYLPIDVWIKKYTTTNMNSNDHTTKTTYIHYDMNKITHTYAKRLFDISVCNHVGELYGGKNYTFSYRISNVTPSSNRTVRILCWYLTADGSSEYIEKTGYIRNGIYYNTFAIPENSMITNYIFGYDSFQWTNPFNLTWDFEFLGLCKGTEPITKLSNTILGSSTPVLSTQNQIERIGEYTVSKHVLHHIKQIERNIQKNENDYISDWRLP